MKIGNCQIRSRLLHFYGRFGSKQIKIFTYCLVLLLSFSVSTWAAIFYCESCNNALEYRGENFYRCLSSNCTLSGKEIHKVHAVSGDDDCINNVSSPSRRLTHRLPSEKGSSSATPFFSLPPPRSATGQSKPAIAEITSGDRVNLPCNDDEQKAPTEDHNTNTSLEAAEQPLIADLCSEAIAMEALTIDAPEQSLIVRVLNRKFGPGFYEDLDLSLISTDAFHAFMYRLSTFEPENGNTYFKHIHIAKLAAAGLILDEGIAVCITDINTGIVITDECLDPWEIQEKSCLPKCPWIKQRINDSKVARGYSSSLAKAKARSLVKKQENPDYKLTLSTEDIVRFDDKNIRLQTFKDHHSVYKNYGWDTEELAVLGFFHNGAKAIVRCAYCAEITSLTPDHPLQFLHKLKCKNRNRDNLYYKDKPSSTRKETYSEDLQYASPLASFGFECRHSDNNYDEIITTRVVCTCCSEEISMEDIGALPNYHANKTYKFNLRIGQNIKLRDAHREDCAFWHYINDRLCSE